ncbi:MAG: hypothetical protein IJW78_03465 [Clostridia bacterium]|nr:hypothetical protein [Clostridia bacterium]
MITAILIMLWLVSCGLCTVAGFFTAQKHKTQKTAVLPEPSAEEQKRFAQEMREMENFFAYDGSEQSISVNTQ